MFDFVSRARNYLGEVWSRPHLLGTQNIAQARPDPHEGYAPARDWPIIAARSKLYEQSDKLFILITNVTSAANLCFLACFFDSEYLKSRYFTDPRTITWLPVLSSTFFLTANGIKWVAQKKVEAEFKRALERNGDAFVRWAAGIYLYGRRRLVKDV